MDNTAPRGYKMRKILKIFLLILLFSFIGLIVYSYVRIIPQDIHFTNVSSSSFTVSWNTRFPTKGAAVVIESKNKLPIGVGMPGNSNSYDTRDVREAELLASAETSQKVSENESFSVSIEDFVTEIVVSPNGSYYTHHVEVKGLDPQKEYSVMVGDGIVFFNSQMFTETDTITTTAIPESLDTPVPVYGQIKDAKNEDKSIEELDAVTDGVVYFNYLDEFTGEKSQMFSSPLNTEGSWYIDTSEARSSDGEHFMDKYKDNITNILGELVIDAGQLGIWKKTINMKESSPVETIVLNIPEASQDKSNPESLIRTDALYNNNSDSSVVKGVNAMEDGCQWISFCGCGKKVGGQWKDCACDSNTLKQRKCSGQQTAQEAISSLDSNTCGGGGTPGSHALYGGVCKVCAKAEGKTFYTWQTTDRNKCSGNGQIESPAVDTGEGNANNVQAVGDGIPDQMIVTTSIRLCLDPDGCTCIYNWKTTSEKRISVSTTQSCNPNGTVSGLGAGILQSCFPSQPCTYDTATGKEGMCSADGLSCVNVEKSVTCGGEANKGKTCVYLGRIGTCNLNVCVVPVDNAAIEGKPCVDNSQSLTNGIYRNGVCTQRDNSTTLTTNSIKEGDGCHVSWYLDLFAQVKDENGNTITYNCVGNKYVKYTAPVNNCIEGDKCSLIAGMLDMCQSTSGKMLQCMWGSWKTYSGPLRSSENAVTQVKSINPKEKCQIKGADAEKKCSCNGKLLNNNDICPEVGSCGFYVASYGWVANEVMNETTNGKVCNKAGNTCSNGLCTGDKISDSGIKTGLKVFAQETSSSEYIIDQSSGKVLNIQPGLYSVTTNDENFVFMVKSSDVEDKSGDVLIYADENENGKYDEGEKKVSEFGTQVTIQTIGIEYNYNLKAGFNFVTFPFLVDDESARTAAGLLKMLNAQYFDSIYSIAKYDGSWSVVGQNTEVYSNNDFQLVPGQGYIIKANKNVDVIIAGRPVKSDSTSNSITITFFPGWNLIGTYGSNVKQYTAKSLIQSINNYETIDFTSDNVSRWESDVQRYDGYQLTNENGIDIEYGFDFPINTLQSYFVRILQGKGNWQPEVE